MTEINHFKVFAFFSGDMVMIGQPRWIGCMSKKLVEAHSFI
jgi:hypothetical protein